MTPFCGLPQSFRGDNATGRAQWPVGHTITIGVEDAFPGFDVHQTEQIIERAIPDLNAVCGAKVAQLSTESRPNILIRKANLGNSGILAQAQLPFGATANTQLWAQFNTQVRFVDAVNPSAQSFPIMPVFQHECWGHNMGLGHEQSPQPSLMDPSIGDILRFTPDDPFAGELVARYGPPGGTVDPPKQPGCPIPSLLRLAGIPEEVVQSATRNWMAFVEQVKRGLK